MRSSGYTTRSIQNTPFFKTRLFTNSFFPSTIIEWNNLDLIMRNSSSLKISRNGILKFIRPAANNFVNIHNRKGIKFTIGEARSKSLAGAQIQA